MEAQSIAVVGGGIAGLATAWLLGKRHRVTLFEKNAYIGGHTHTVDVSTEQGPVAVDTGFIVYNEQNYPHLTALLRDLGVTSQPSDMSFSVSIGAGSVEYAGNSLNTLFAQRANLISPTYAGMLLDILRFNRSAKRLLSEQPAEQLTLGDFLSRGGYSEAFRDYYVLPMAAAIWSCPTGAMLRFPLLSFVRFFANHGLLNLSRRPMWRTVVGGGRSYVERILNSGRMSVHRADPVERVSRDTAGVWVQTACGYRDRFDQVVLACHADQALAIIEQPRDGEARVLGSFHYQAKSWLKKTLTSKRNYWRSI